MTEAEHRALHEKGIEHHHGNMTVEEHNRMHAEGIPHEHLSEDHSDQIHLAGHVHTHRYTDSEGNIHTHVHKHDPDNSTMVINRLARAIGHLESVKRMVEDGRDCAEILVQLSAVKSAINNTGKIILKDHMEHCIIDAVETNNEQALLDLEHAIDHFIS